MTAEKGLPTDLTASSVLFMDMDNDGRVDLLVAAAAGGIRVFIQSATGSFVDAGVDFIQGELPGVVERMEIGKTDNGQSVVFLDTGSDAIFSRRRALQIEWVADGTRRLTSCQSGHPSSVRKRDSVVRIL